MIAGYPDQDSMSAISKFKRSLNLESADEVFGKDYFHVTLRVWYGAEYENLEEDVSEWLKENVQPQVALCQTDGLDLFGDDGALVLRLESDKLARLQSRIDDGIQELGVPPSDYRTYKPHLTIADGMKKAPPMRDAFSVRLDRWKMVNFEDKIFWEC